MRKASTKEKGVAAADLDHSARMLAPSPDPLQLIARSLKASDEEAILWSTGAFPP